MARDRKRAKQRQRRRAGQQPRQPARVPEAEEREREAREEPAPVEDHIAYSAHERDPNAAPDPLAHSSADVDIAELAEASVQEPGAPKGPLEADEYPHPDELEGADELGREHAQEKARHRAGRAAAPGGALPKEGNRFVNFLRACWAELRRVQWPDRRQVGQATTVVLVFVIIAGGYLGLLDAVFSRLVNVIL